MKHCRKWEEQITLFALGELGAAAEEELHRHIDLCSPCRALYEQLLAEEKVIVRAFAAMGAPMREASLSAKSAIGGQRPEGTHALGTIGKIAAAIVIAGGIIGLAICLLRLGSATPAFADIAGPILKSTTCTFKVTTEIKDANGPGVGHAMFAAPGRVRVEYGDGEPDVHITDFEQQRMLVLMPAKKMAMLCEFENMPPEKIDAIRYAGLFGVREAIEQAGDSAQYLGEQEIEGRIIVGYQIEEPMAETVIWAYADTFLPVRIETSIAKYLGVEARCVMSEFVFDVKLDESLFSMAIPEGYQSETMRVDASLPEEREFLELLRMYADNMGGSFPQSLSPDAFIEVVAMAGRISPPHDLTEEQKVQLRQELDSILDDAKANLLRLQAIIEDDEQPEDVESLAERIALNLKAFGEYEENKSSLEEEVRKATDEWLDSGTLTIMRNAFEEMQPAMRGLAFLYCLPADSDWRYAGQGVTLGESNVPIFSYKPKGSNIYRVIYGDLTIQEAAVNNLPDMPMPERPLVEPVSKDDFVAQKMEEYRLSKEAQFVWSLGVCADFCDGSFPSSVGEASIEFRKYQLERLQESGKPPSNLDVRQLRNEMMRVVDKILRLDAMMDGLFFAYCLNPENDMCYSGRGVTVDDGDIPIFWYKPDGAELYRVIYADLTVEDFAAENLPQAPEGAQKYEDLHKELDAAEIEPELPSDPEAVAVLQQVRAAYASSRTYQTTQTSTRHSVSTAVVDANELAAILPESYRDIVHSQEFSQALMDESDWSKSFRVILTRPSDFLVEEVSNAAAPEAAWYEDGEYQLFSFGRHTSSSRRACPPFADDTILELFYDPNETLGDLEGAHLLGDETLDGHLCYVLVARKFSREFKFWITKDAHLILKIIKVSQYENVPESPNEELLNNTLALLGRGRPAYRAQVLRSLIHHYLAKKVMVDSKTTTTYDHPAIDRPVPPEQLIPPAYRQELGGAPNPAGILRRVKEKYDSLDTYVTTGVVDNDFRRTRFDDVNNLPGIPRETGLKLQANEDFRKLLATGRRSLREFTLRFSRPHYCMEWLIDGRKRNAAWSDSAGHHTLVGGHHTVRPLYVSSDDLWSFGTTIHPIFYDGYNNLLNTMTDPQLLPDEPVNGDTCYVIAGVRYSSKFTLWISRRTLLIRKLLIDYEYTDRRKLKLTDDDAHKFLTLLDKEPISENRKWLDQLIEGGFLAAGLSCGHTVETYLDMTVNMPLSADQLVPEIAAGLAGD